MNVKTRKIIICVIACLFVVGIIVGLWHTGDSELSVVAKSSLEKVIEIDELSSIEYTYNAVATKKKNKEKLYYVAYEGKIVAGIDFKEIDVKVEKGNTVVVTLPDVEIQSAIVDIKSMDFIFTKSKYETEEITQEAYKLCKEDLKSRADKDSDFKMMARENAMDTVEALFKPWIESLDSDYKLEVK